KAKVSVKEIQKKYQPKVTKPKKVEHQKSLAAPKPRKPRFLFRWSPIGRLFNQEGKIVDSSKSKSKSAFSNGDNACTSNTMEPKIKRFPNSTSLLDRMVDCDTVPTPMVEQAKLKLDLVGNPVNHTDYHSMIGSLMYVILSRPDIMFATDHAGRHLD
nr:hypothetical protein [Tanacetum cinerariifolium]